MRVQKKYSGINSYAFTATATKLAAGTRYAYRIVTSGGSTAWTSFTTARAGLDRPWTFLAFGDTQVANTGVPEDLIDTAIARNPTAPLLLHAGDVVNKPSSITQWRQFMTATYPTRDEPQLADLGGQPRAVRPAEEVPLRCTGRRSAPTTPGRATATRARAETWYYTDYQGVRFIVLDTFGGDLKQQSAFLDTALKTNRQRWTVVLQHAGPFASRSDRNNSGIRAAFLPLYEKYKVDLVLSGHDHSYNRGYDGNPNSTVYAVSDSGPKFYEASGKDWARGGATRVASASHTSTYQQVTVSPEHPRVPSRGRLQGQGIDDHEEGGPGARPGHDHQERHDQDRPLTQPRASRNRCYSNLDGSPAPTRTTSAAPEEKSTTVVGTSPQSPESSTASST